MNMTIVSFFYENGISFNVADSSSFSCMIEESMKYAKQDPLHCDKVIQSQVISLSSIERNWSAHWHIHTKICNRLDPATTEKLVYVYSNSKLVASTRDADKLKMFALDNERPDGPGQARGAESLISARGARRESRLRASARLGQPGHAEWQETIS